MAFQNKIKLYKIKERKERKNTPQVILIGEQAWKPLG